MINLFNKIFSFNASVAEQIAIKGEIKERLREKKEEKERYKNILKAIKREAKSGKRYIIIFGLSDILIENLKNLGFSLQEIGYLTDRWKIGW